MRFVGLTVALVFLVLPLSADPAAGRAAEATTGDVASGIESLVDEYARVGAFSGAMLVADDSGIVVEKAYGLANRDWGIPNAPDTRFRIGSLSKQFTAALVMRLVDEGRLDLDARLIDVLPWYREDTGGQVTIRHLLNHTSGIDRSGVPEMIEEHACATMPLAEEVARYCSGDLETEPGARFAYNNAGYLILGAVVEEVYSAPYPEVLRKVITDPVGMPDTGMDDSHAILARRAEGYVRGAEGLRKPAFVEATLAGPAGGIYSTVGDLYRWDRALYTDAVLSANVREQMFTPGPGPYGFGWFVIDMPVGPDGEPRTVIRHPGQGDGFHSVLWRIPADGIAVILINNLGRTDLEEMASGILDVLYGRAPRMGIGVVMRDAIDTGGFDAARQTYFRLRDEAGERYDFAEAQLNDLGYAMIMRGSTEEGVAVLALNAEVFPESANAQDSLGEACEFAGDSGAAVQCYRKALELDPEFEHASERLRELVGQE